MKTRIVQNEPNDPASGGGSPTTSHVDLAASPAMTTPTNGFRAFVRRRELVIFFALTYLIAWSTLPFGSFLAFAPIVSAIVVVAGRRGLAGAGSAGSARHSLASELDLVRGCDRPAPAGPRGGDRSQHGRRCTCTLWSPVPAVVRGAVAVRPPNGQFHRWAVGRRASLARLCAAATAIEVVSIGVSGTARSADHRSGTCLWSSCRSSTSHCRT